MGAHEGLPPRLATKFAGARLALGTGGAVETAPAAERWDESSSRKEAPGPFFFFREVGDRPQTLSRRFTPAFPPVSADPSRI